MLKRIKPVVLGLIALAGIVIVAGIAFEQWSRWSISRNYEPIGELIEIDGSKMHLYCSGKGTPTVVFESGLGESSASWDEVQPEIAKTTRVCSYDRAGRLWSERQQKPVTAAGTVTRLHQLLNAASVEPPYVMVGHSLGGPLIMVYADRYPQDVSGVVLVDAAHPDNRKRLPQEILKAISLQGLDRTLYTIKAETGFMRLFETYVYDGISYQGLAERKNLPQTTPGYFTELDAAEHIFAEASETMDFGDLPLIVLTATNYSKEALPEIAPEQWEQFEKAGAEMQTELAALSTRGEQRVIADAGHYIHYARPDAVIQAILDVLAVTRESGG